MAESSKIPWLRDVPDGEVAMAVAHQDDETFMSRVFREKPGLTVIHVTDGAPKNSDEWKGLATGEGYAELRARELAAPLSAAGHYGQRISLKVRDRAASRSIETVIRGLRSAFVRNKPSIICTHAFEGGHPD